MVISMSIFAIKRFLRKNIVIFNALKACYHSFRRIIVYPKMKSEEKNLFLHIEEAHCCCSPVIWFFGVATHPNLGDLAQTCCILKWLKKNYPDSKIIEISSRQFYFSETKCVGKLKTAVKEDDLIVFQSGYTMTDEHEHEQMRRIIFKTFPHTRTVVLPQTIYYRSEKNKSNAIETFRGHKNLTLFARDKISYETAKNLFPDVDINLYPDIVTSMIGNFSSKSTRSGVLFCIRDDYEKLYSSRQITSIINRISKFAPVSQKDTTVRIKNTWDRASVERTIMDAILEYSSYRAIVTDRYHGTIFSLIAGTPVVVLKTTDHKVISGADWFLDIYPDYISVAEKLEDVEPLLKKIISKRLDHVMQPYFEEQYYSQLKNLIERKA